VTLTSGLAIVPWLNGFYTKFWLKVNLFIAKPQRWKIQLAVFLNVYNSLGILLMLVIKGLQISWDSKYIWSIFPKMNVHSNNSDTNGPGTQLGINLWRPISWFLFILGQGQHWQVVPFLFEYIWDWTSCKHISHGITSLIGRGGLQSFWRSTGQLLTWWSFRL
jgi:hypothetical protein